MHSVLLYPLPHSEKHGYSEKDGCKKAQRCIILQTILNRQYMKSILKIEGLPKNMPQKIFHYVHRAALEQQHWHRVA
jgi:hypothetical protein